MIVVVPGGVVAGMVRVFVDPTLTDHRLAAAVLGGQRLSDGLMIPLKLYCDMSAEYLPALKTNEFCPVDVAS